MGQSPGVTGSQYRSLGWVHPTSPTTHSECLEPHGGDRPTESPTLEPSPCFPSPSEVLLPRDPHALHLGEVAVIEGSQQEALGSLLVLACGQLSQAWRWGQGEKG